MEGLSFTDGNDQQGEPPSDPVGCLYRDVLTKDGQRSPEGACRAEPERWAGPSSRSEPEGQEEEVERPRPPAPQHIHLHQPIRSLCGAAGAGSGPLTVTGAIQTISDEEILENRETEEGIRNIPRFRRYQPGVPSRVPPLPSAAKPALLRKPG